MDDLWAIGYDDMERAGQVKNEVVRLGWDGPYLILSAVAVVDTVRTKGWRYIRYADGSEELYDHAKDPHEWTNLAANPSRAIVRKRLAALLPRDEAPELPRLP